MRTTLVFTWAWEGRGRLSLEVPGDCPGARGGDSVGKLWDQPLPSFNENSSLCSPPAVAFVMCKGLQVAPTFLTFTVIFLAHAQLSLNKKLLLSLLSPTHADVHHEDLAHATICLESSLCPSSNLCTLSPRRKETSFSKVLSNCLFSA